MKGYRAIVLNVVVGLGAILALPEVTGLIPQESVKYVIAAQAVMNVVLRFLTTTPIGESEQ